MNIDRMTNEEHAVTDNKHNDIVWPIIAKGIKSWYDTIEWKTNALLLFHGYKIDSKYPINVNYMQLQVQNLSLNAWIVVKCQYFQANFMTSLSHMLIKEEHHSVLLPDA